MESYKHTVQYYETDKMGITHHSNYIRWMEEARVDFLQKIGWDYAKLENEGIISPVLEVSCKYRKSTTFSDDVVITVRIKEYKGVRFVFSYEMKDSDGNIVAEAESFHCFLNSDGKPVRPAKDFPEFHNTLIKYISDND
ncbi:MAG: acyl-CoA thioesterase [Clostridia bacterium]|nr:acyl-CoA thioesterase [Clostridia bacterium]